MKSGGLGRPSGGLNGFQSLFASALLSAVGAAAAAGAALGFPGSLKPGGNVGTGGPYGALGADGGRVGSCPLNQVMFLFAVFRGLHDPDSISLPGTRYSHLGP